MGAHHGLRGCALTGRRGGANTEREPPEGRLRPTALAETGARATDATDTIALELREGERDGEGASEDLIHSGSEDSRDLDEAHAGATDSLLLTSDPSSVLAREEDGQPLLPLDEAEFLEYGH